MSRSWRLSRVGGRGAVRGGGKRVGAVFGGEDEVDRDDGRDEGLEGVWRGRCRWRWRGRDEGGNGRGLMVFGPSDDLDRASEAPDDGADALDLHSCSGHRQQCDVDGRRRGGLRLGLGRRMQGSGRQVQIDVLHVGCVLAGRRRPAARLYGAQWAWRAARGAAVGYLVGCLELRRERPRQLVPGSFGAMLLPPVHDIIPLCHSGPHSSRRALTGLHLDVAPPTFPDLFGRCRIHLPFICRRSCGLTALIVR